MPTPLGQSGRSIMTLPVAHTVQPRLKNAIRPFKRLFSNIAKFGARFKRFMRDAMLEWARNQRAGD